MTTAQASRVVFVAALLEGMFILARAKRGGVSRETTVRALWAIGALSLGLSMLADFVPQIAGPFALLVLVALAARSHGELGTVLGLGPTTSAVPADAAAAPAPRFPNPRAGGGTGGRPT